MTPEEFEKIVEARKTAISRTLATKAHEYARGGDRLHNFKRAADFARATKARVCWMFAMKHLTSIADLVDDVDADKDIPEALSDEKIGDAINYLILLEAILHERREAQKAGGKCPF